MAKAEANVRLIDILDDKTRDNIMHLYHKLQDMKAEIDAKLASEPQDATAEESPTEALDHLSAEVDLAIENLETLMGVKLEEGMDSTTFLEMNQRSIEELADVLETNVKHIAKIKDEF